MRLSGAIFDLDGTLGDSVPVSVKAIIRTVAAFTGKTYSYTEIIDRFGPVEEGIIRRLIPEEDWAASYPRFLQEYEALHQTGNYGVFPGIPGVLDLLHEHHVPTAVVTGKGLDSAKISLRYFGLADVFEMVEAGSMERSIKEDCIRKVAQAWNLPLEEIIYVGDASSDVTFAHRAGVKPVSAAWAGTQPAEELAAENPYRLFTRVADLKAWLAGQVDGAAP